MEGQNEQRKFIHNFSRFDFYRAVPGTVGAQVSKLNCKRCSAPITLHTEMGLPASFDPSDRYCYECYELITDYSADSDVKNKPHDKGGDNESDPEQEPVK